MHKEIYDKIINLFSEEIELKNNNYSLKETSDIYIFQIQNLEILIHKNIDCIKLPLISEKTIYSTCPYEQHPHREKIKEIEKYIMDKGFKRKGINASGNSPTRYYMP